MSFDCPESDCGRTFDTEHGMKTHRGHAHPESARKTAVCKHCDEEFEPGYGSTGTYCSNECCTADKRVRVTLVCEQCNEEFELPRHQAKGRKYCSNECNGAADRQRVELDCAHCGDPFEVHPHVSDQRTFCSIDCRSASMARQVKRECEACGRGFSTNQARTNRCCSVACRSELATSQPRPDDVEGLLWLLYVYEGHNARETWLRANANLDPEDQLTLKETKERLRENHWMRGGGVAKYENVSPEDVGLTSVDQTPQDQPWHKYYRATADGGDTR